jgi:hypothetical protein
MRAPGEPVRPGGSRLAVTLGLAYLVVAAMGRLAYATPHLLGDVAPWSAVDLKYRFNEVAVWFSGQPVYGVVDGAVYPPASHAILWPLLGWLSLPAARLFWLLTTLGAATLIAVVAWRAAAGTPTRERWLLCGLAYAAYPLQLSVFVGQMGMHVTAAAMGGALLLFTLPTRRGTDLLASALLALALVKPTLSLPLLLCVLISTWRLRPLAFTAGAYLLLTAIAVSAQPAGALELVRDWLVVSGERVPFGDGVPNLHMLLSGLGLGAWMTPASLLLLGLMGAWMVRRRAADPWVLLGIAGVVARLWAHSTLYDDAFLLLPTLALFRIALRTGGFGSWAGKLFFGAWVVLLTPTWAVYDLGPVVAILIHAFHTALWVGVLAYLVAHARAALSPLGPLDALGGERVDLQT